MHRFSTTTPPRLSIEMRAGDISVDTREGTETTVEVFGARDDPETQAAVADTIVDQRGEDVVVLVPKRAHGLFGRTPRLRVDITAPHGSRLDVRSDSADLTARGTYGESRVTSGSGEISIEQLAGATHLRTGSGNVQVRGTSADLTVGTGSGDVQLGAIGSANLQSGSGDIEVESAAGPLRVRTGSGDIAVGRAEDEVSARTGSGDVAVRRVSHGRVRAQAASGDLHVGVADGVPAWLDVRTVTGGVSSDLDATEAVGAHEQHVRLELNTVSGDIDIARA